MIAAQALADTDIDAARTLYQQKCLACHGVAANDGSIAFPKLAGQQYSYLRKALLDYQEGATGVRPQPIMNAASQTLSLSDIANISAYLSTLPASNGSVAKTQLELGQKLYRTGDIQRHIPACAACHGPTGAGNLEAVYPQLAGQNPDYIVQQLQAFASDQRRSDPKRMMRDIAATLTLADQQAVASFIYGLRPINAP